MATSTKTSGVSLRQKDGTVHVAVYDRVGPLRVLEHLVQVEVAARYARVPNNSEPLPVELRDLLVNPQRS